MSAPAIVIRLELEGRPIVYVDTLHEGDLQRLEDWLRASPERSAIFERALELAGQREVTL